MIESAMAELPHGWGQDGAPDGPPPSSAVLECAHVRILYAPMIALQEAEVQRVRGQGHVQIPDGFDFAAITGLSTEELQKLSLERPATLDQASKIPGITPKAVLHLHRKLIAQPRKKSRKEIHREIIQRNQQQSAQREFQDAL